MPENFKYKVQEIYPDAYCHTLSGIWFTVWSERPSPEAVDKVEKYRTLTDRRTPKWMWSWQGEVTLLSDGFFRQPQDAWQSAYEFAQENVLKLLQGETHKLSPAVCPHCGGTKMSHGHCTDCDKFCGCSFDPTSRNDYCSHHRP